MVDNPRSLRVAFLGVVLVLVSVATPKFYEQSLDTLNFQDHTQWTSADIIPIIYVSNDYSERSPSAGRMYPWLAGKYIVEPFHWTTFRLHPDIALNNTRGKFLWSIDGHAVGQGVEIQHMFKTLSSHEVEVAWVQDLTGRFMKLGSASLICRYVRREIRRLSLNDRVSFFDAARILWVTDFRDGIKLYGSAFRPAHHFVQMHLELAGARECDHMHDGLGFLTQHVAITALFESALQVVDPKVALPFWDFTIDAADVYRQHDGDFASIFQSPVFGTDWFGNASNKLHTVTSGRWAYTTVAHESGINDTSFERRLANAYGYLRAPWNTLKSPFVTRVQHDMCGMAPEYLLSFPGCVEHYRALTEYHTWYDFAWNLPYSPHGPVHAFLGGNLGCDQTFDRLEDELGIPSSLVTPMRGFAFAYLKNLWRESKPTLLECPYFCSPDTPQQSCKCWCTRSDSGNDSWWREYIQHICIEGPNDDDATVSIDCTNLTLYQKRRLVEILCESGIGLDGDHLEASSPSDISFWSIHPTIERLWQFKKLSKTFTNESWPEREDTDQTATLWPGCYGHYASDVLKFPTLILKGPQTFTNVQLYNYMDPQYNSLPYIYEDFEWQHCLDAGYNFSEIHSPRPMQP